MIHYNVYHKAREMAHDHKHREIVIDYKPDNLGIYEKVSVIQCLHLSMWTDIVLTGTKSLKFRKNETKITKIFSYFPLPLKIATALLSAFQGNWLISATQQTITNAFKVYNKDTRTKPMKSFRCLYCKLWTYFTPFSSVFIVDFEHVFVCWDRNIHILKIIFYCLFQFSIVDTRFVNTLWWVWHAVQRT